MDKNYMDKFVCFYQELFNELYVIETIVNMTRNSCLEQEFNGQYYGATGENSAQLSAERNNYINMLTILSEKISNIMNLNLSAEREMLLQEHSNDSGRKITAESSTDQGS